MENNLVSIIMPVYNNEKYLSAAIESILNQTYKDIELLILDDGSTDSSLSIIEKYAMENRNIRLISRDNKGVAYSIDELLGYANGEYIGRMNGDDISYPDRIETQVKYLKDNSDVCLIGSYIDIEVTDYKNSCDQDMCEKIFNFKFDKENLPIKLLNGNKICHGTFLSRASVFNNNKYNLTLKSMEDMELIFRLIEQGSKVDVIHKKLYLNRVNSEFIHKQKGLNEEYNKEMFRFKTRFIDKFVGNRGICIVGKGSVSNQLYEVLNSSKVRVNNVVNEINSQCDLEDIAFDYVIILDRENREDIENSLISIGKKNLSDFISF